MKKAAIFDLFGVLVEQGRANFDKFYYSGATGFMKPDPRCYELILQENNLAATDVVYFDDNEKHVAAANIVGIASYLFAGPEQVREKVK